MGRFQDELLEIGKYSNRFPTAKLGFDVPLASLARRNDALASVSGNWKVSIYESERIIVEAEGSSGEEALKSLLDKLRIIE
jgi:hypothetical protein